MGKKTGTSMVTHRIPRKKCKHNWVEKKPALTQTYRQCQKCKRIELI